MYNIYAQILELYTSIDEIVEPEISSGPTLDDRTGAGHKDVPREEVFKPEKPDVLIKPKETFEKQKMPGVTEGIYPHLGGLGYLG